MAQSLLLKILLLFTLAIFSSCDLEENPPFLDESVYTDPEVVVSALDGIYAALTTYNAQERRLFVINGYSGFFNTKSVFVLLNSYSLFGNFGNIALSAGVNTSKIFGIFEK